MLNFKLNDSNEIPAVGFGVFMIKPNGPTYDAVGEAIKAGYRHFDTTAAYFNEAGLGRAVRLQVRSFCDSRFRRVSSSFRSPRIRGALQGTLIYLILSLPRARWRKSGRWTQGKAAMTRRRTA